MKHLLLTAAATAALLLGSAVQAGPFILSGTDSDDHGSATTVNLNGWLYMQKALENIAPGVTTGNKVVTILGSTGAALAAAESAFDKSSLVSAGWSRVTVSVANFGTFFGAGGNLGTGILMMDSNGNVGGGVAGATFNIHATAIDNFLAAGGGLFSQSNGYSWLTTLLPGVSVNLTAGTEALALTAAGNAAFPGLTDADLSTGPWHNSFNNIGALTELAYSPNNPRRNVIIGGRTGSITGQVPEPGTLALLGLGLFGMGLMRRKA